jgi:hypothetical protein
MKPVDFDTKPSYALAGLSQKGIASETIADALEDAKMRMAWI